MVVPSAGLSGGFVPMTTLGPSSNNPPCLLSFGDHTMKVHVFSAEDGVRRTLYGIQYSHEAGFRFYHIDFWRRYEPPPVTV